MKAVRIRDAISFICAYCGRQQFLFDETDEETAEFVLERKMVKSLDREHELNCDVIACVQCQTDNLIFEPV